MAEKSENLAEVEASSSNDSDVDMESDDSDGGEDFVSQEEIKLLKSRVAENRYAYKQQVELLKLLRTAGELQQLRDARNEMHKTFPLSPTLWKEWIEDEMKVLSSDDDRDKIIELYERALEDYVCVELWLQYVTFTIGDVQRKGHKHVRDVFEKAITAVGLHVSKGSLVWKAYQEFEVAILAGLMPSDDSKEQTPEEKERVTAQEKTVISLFKRQLAIPLVDLEQTYTEYKSFVEDVNPEVEATYTKTRKILDQLLPFEDSLTEADPPRSEQYKTYIKHELKGKDPSRICCIFERAITENCLKADFWLKYGKYLDLTLQSRSGSLRMYRRAVRNCPWSADLWVNHLRNLERYEYDSHQLIVDEFKKAIKCDQMNLAEDYLKVWTAYVDYMRRRIEWERDDKERIEELRKTFQEATDFLDSSFGNEGDPNCTLLMYQARIESKFCKNMDKARECWNTIMQQGFGNQAQPWLEYFNLERSFGDHKHCRKILQRAVNSVTDWPEYVVEAFINFEREEGTLEQLDQALEKCEKQMARIEERRAKAAEKEQQFEEQTRSQRQAGKKQNRPQQYEPKTSVSKKKAEHLSPKKVAEQVSPQKQEQPSTGKDADGFRVPSLPSAVATASPVTPASRRPPPGYRGARAPPPGYKSDTPDESDEPPVKKQKVDVSSAAGSSAQQKPEASAEELNRNKCTVFVSNLDFNIKECDLTPIFIECGELRDIRLTKGFGNKSRGFGYVEFKSEESAKAALALDRHEIDKRPMYVSSYRGKEEGKAEFKYANNMEKNKLFVKNLPVTSTKETVTELFTKYGEVKDVRLPTYRNGTYKGIAFVEFENEASAAKAVMGADGQKVGDQEISVAISNPPKRNAPLPQRDQGEATTTSGYKPSLGGGKKEADRGGKAKTLLAFQPRSIQGVRKATVSASTKSKPALSGSGDSIANSTTGDKPTGQPAKLSNADFRNMLMK